MNAKTIINQAGELWEMANLQPRETGLSRRIWVSPNPHTGHNRPRLKVDGTDNRLYPVGIDDPIEALADWPEGWSTTEFQDLQRFIVLNRDMLLAYWNEQVGTTELRIRPI